MRLLHLSIVVLCFCLATHLVGAQPNAEFKVGGQVIAVDCATLSRVPDESPLCSAACGRTSCVNGPQGQSPLATVHPAATLTGDPRFFWDVIRCLRHNRTVMHAEARNAICEEAAAYGVICRGCDNALWEDAFVAVVAILLIVGILQSCCVSTGERPSLQDMIAVLVLIYAMFPSSWESLAVPYLLAIIWRDGKSERGHRE